MGYDHAVLIQVCHGGVTVLGSCEGGGEVMNRCVQ
jgi:hypothetical protein